MSNSLPADLAQLRQHIETLERRSRVLGVLPFGISTIDDRLPGGGLSLGALHEMAGSGDGTIDGAAAGLFAAGIAARTEGKVMWCAAQSDLYAPGLSQAVAGRLTDLSDKLDSVSERDDAFPRPQNRGDDFRHGEPGTDPRTLKPNGSRAAQPPVIRVRSRDFKIALRICTTSTPPRHHAVSRCHSYVG